MKILLSAYACEPNVGSEPEVGWSWAVALANLGHEVSVITRTSNRARIEKQLAGTSGLPNINFYYCDLPPWAKWWKRGVQGVHLYYFIWQIMAYFFARQVHSAEAFDIVHHVTFVSARQPSFMGLLGVPFIFGPVAGGEAVPFRLRKSYPLRGVAIDLFRDLVNFWVRFDPFMHLTFSKAAEIYVTSRQTMRLIPAHYHHKVKVQLAIATSDTNCPVAAKIRTEVVPKGLKILYAGHLLYLKGVHLGLNAFARFHESYPQSTFTIVGRGPQEGWLKRTAEKLGISPAVNWMPWLEQQQLMELYQEYDVFLFPSLRDSGGYVVLEAFSKGLPVICLNLGGPGVLVDETCGRVITTDGKSEGEVVDGLIQAFHEFMTVPTLRDTLSKGAVSRLKTFSRLKIASKIYKDIEANVIR